MMCSYYSVVDSVNSLGWQKTVLASGIYESTVILVESNSKAFTVSNGTCMVSAIAICLFVCLFFCRSVSPHPWLSLVSSFSANCLGHFCICLSCPSALQEQKHIFIFLIYLILCSLSGQIIITSASSNKLLLFNNSLSFTVRKEEAQMF